jgi:hypothetical protein
MSSNPLILCCSPSATQTNALRLTDTEFQIYMNILANGLTITPTSLSYCSGLTSNVETRLTNNATSITALNNKTAQISNTTGGTTTVYSGTHNFQGTTQMITGSTLNINGTAKIVMNSPTSYINLASSLGILTTGTIYINASELSMLDGASSNIQTSINSINTSITDLNTKTTDISYSPIPATTTIANAVSCTGSLKVSQQAWLDGAVKLKTTWVAPVSGELGYNLSATLSPVASITTNVVKNLLSVTLPIGVYVITYNCYVIYGSSTTVQTLKIGLNTTSGSTQPVVAQSTEQVISYTGTKSYSSTYIANVSSSTTYYLTLYALFSTGLMSVDGNNVNLSDLRAVKIA